MYEESVFNPEIRKALINLIPMASTEELQAFMKNADEELLLIINKELIERG